jgi:hypothetical protein
MNNTDQLQMLLSLLAAQLPILLVCLVACVLILTRWKQANGGSMWALLGFGLPLILCILIPVGQISVQSWIMHSNNVAHSAYIFTGLAVLWSVLRAVSYALLLAAVFAGRSAPQPASPPPWKPE